MIIEVEMLAFGNEIREVDIPDEVCLIHGWDEDPNRVLDSVFYYGQNDFQPRNQPSVSAGDVIRWKDNKYLVAGMGFKQLTDEQLNQYRALSTDDRFIGRCQIEIGETIVGRRNK